MSSDRIENGMISEPALLQRKTVLLADDDAVLAETYQDILEAFGYSVMVRNDGAAALAAAQGAVSVDLVITDYQMPGMNGIEFIRQLKRTRPDIPVIMLSGSITVDRYLQAMHAGALECAEKPHRTQDLLRMVSATLKQKTLYHHYAGDRSVTDMKEQMKKFDAKLNCWEAKRCGREPGGVKAGELGICPVTTDANLHGAHGGKNAGRACWAVAGSLCGGKVQGTYAQKLDNCWRCEFMNAVKREEEPTLFGFSATRLGMERVMMKVNVSEKTKQ